MFRDQRCAPALSQMVAGRARSARANALMASDFLPGVTAASSSIACVGWLVVGWFSWWLTGGLYGCLVIGWLVIKSTRSGGNQKIWSWLLGRSGRGRLVKRLGCQTEMIWLLRMIQYVQLDKNQEQLGAGNMHKGRPAHPSKARS